MAVVEIEAAQRDLAALVERAGRGEEIILARDGAPLAKLVPTGENLGPRVFGSMRGQIHVPDDFDDPLPEELLALFYGDTEPEAEWRGFCSIHTSCSGCSTGALACHRLCATR